jgi:hypothetical protein
MFMEGESLAIFWNGNEVFNVADTSIASSGAIGIVGGVGSTFQNFQASVPTGPTPVSSLPYSDSFAGANSPVIGGNWVEDAGDFAIRNNAAVALAGGSIALLDGVSQAAVVQSALVNPVTNGCARLLARWENANNYYAAQLCRTAPLSASIYKVVNGVVTTLATGTPAVGSGTLQFFIQNSILTLSVNGAVVVVATDGSLTGAGAVAINGPTGTTFQNYTLAQVPSPVPATFPFSDTFARANAQYLGGSWLLYQGMYEINNNAAQSLAGGSIALVDGLQSANVMESVKVTAPANGVCARIVARMQSTTEYYMASYCNANGAYSVQLSKDINGTSTTLANVAVSGASGTLGLETIGSSLTIQWNGATVKTVTDTSISAAGALGIWAPAGATFQDFQADN